eukprot:c31648_g1_i1 orf=1-183(-)
MGRALHHFQRGHRHFCITSMSDFLLLVLTAPPMPMLLSSIAPHHSLSSLMPAFQASQSPLS